MFWRKLDSPALAGTWGDHLWLALEQLRWKLYGPNLANDMILRFRNFIFLTAAIRSPLEEPHRRV
ncbi:MAG: hypothetical protein AUG51_16680 [Acidobacteria bacterium 13_1_20CM_3_53_8]|nr:MAG: hypothetical protein AUG51_16680 [Acidobacteria bacterium 13_1_20CM_3_53_8]